MCTSAYLLWFYLWMKTVSNLSWGGSYLKYSFINYGIALTLPLCSHATPPLLFTPDSCLALLNVLACVQLRCQAIFSVLYLAYMRWVSLSLKSYISLNNMILCTHVSPICHSTVFSVLGCITIAMALSFLHGHKKISLCTLTEVLYSWKSRTALYLWIYS